jgi:hypothetical protein
MQALKSRSTSSCLCYKNKPSLKILLFFFFFGGDVGASGGTGVNATQASLKIRILLPYSLHLVDYKYVLAQLAILGFLKSRPCAC